MNCSNGNIYSHTASGVALDKKVGDWPLGRGACLKSKLHSPPPADRNWKPINHSPRVWVGKWGQRTVSILEFVANNGFCKWATGTSLHSMEKSRNWFRRQSSINYVLL